MWGVQGKRRADSLAGDAAIDNNLTLDPPTVIQCVADQLAASRPPFSSYTLSLLNEKRFDRVIKLTVTTAKKGRRSKLS